MNSLIQIQQDNARLSSRVQELRQEIKIRIANNAGADVTLDKVIECFAALTTLADATSITRRNHTDMSWRMRRNQALDVLIELLDSVDPAKPLRAQMLEQGRKWLNDFNSYELWRDLMVYCCIKRTRSDVVTIISNTNHFSDEELDQFERENSVAIQNAYIHGIVPSEGRKLAYPLAQDGARDHWNYLQKLLQFASSETDATTSKERLSTEAG